MIDSSLTPDTALARAGELRIERDRVNAEIFTLAAHWADLHPATGDMLHAGAGDRGREQEVPLAGEGTPLVAEFAPAELGAVLGMSSFAAKALIGDALETRHRLPQLWQRVMNLEVPTYRARQVAQLTRHLSVEAARYVDNNTAPFAHKIGIIRIERIVEAAILRFDPELADDRADDADDQRHITISKTTDPGLGTIHGLADQDLLDALDKLLSEKAAELAQQGDTDPLAIRRVTALGLLAHGGDKPATLYVHVTAETLAEESGIARVEGIGPITLSRLQRWLRHANITVKPVLDLADQASVDGYEIPVRMREAVLLRNPCCTFPFCNNTSRRKDFDHVTRYRRQDEGGPPGQTRLANLQPLCRTHHRHKTHGTWKVTQPYPGIYLWRSRHGHLYLVDHTGTTSVPAAA
jgi:hypothetical protein